MRIDEIASAEEQLALWKLVSDNVWQAIATQVEQDRRARAEKAARNQPKRSKRTGGRGASVKPIAPKPATAAAKPTEPNTAAANKPQASAPQQAIQQQVQPKVAYGARGVQPITPIAPIPPVASSAAVQTVPQTAAKQPKPKITARAGGLTV